VAVETAAPVQEELPPEPDENRDHFQRKLSPAQMELLLSELENLGARTQPVYASVLSQAIGKRIRGFRPKTWGYRSFGAILLELENQGLISLSSHPQSQSPMVELRN
jgi:hypothetical protein